MIHMTVECVRRTQFNVIQTIHCNVGLKCFFSILPKCSFVIIVIYAYFIDISQGSGETHLWCGGICNNGIIANCLQSVPVKEFGQSNSN